MKVLHAASECFPLAKTGGLGDVVGALPLAQRNLGADARVMLPAYRGLRENLRDVRSLGRLQLLGHTFEILQGAAATGLPVFLADCPALFDRDGGPYQDAAGRDYGDNALRFGLYSMAVAEFARRPEFGFVPQLVHLHDWQSALAAAWLAFAPTRPALAFTIHNLAYQGQFGRDSFEALRLPWAWWQPEALEFWGGWSFMKAGITFSDAVTTVSPTYAREIQTADYGCSLDPLLRARAGVLHGIVNGIDDSWNPAADSLIEHPYDASTATAGKRANKRVLQRELGLEPGDTPLLVFIGRLAEQKGADLLLAASEQLLKLPVQIAVLAGGDAALAEAFREFARRAPRGRVAVRIAHDERLAHRYIAAADLLLMPSRFEPCGLTQMYAQRYGTVPVARRTGGLADTVVDATAQTLADGSATGVLFDTADAGGVAWGVGRAVELLGKRGVHEQLQRQGMSRDFSWNASARSYLSLYNELVLAHATAPV